MRRAQRKKHAVGSNEPSAAERGGTVKRERDRAYSGVHRLPATAAAAARTQSAYARTAPARALPRTRIIHVYRHSCRCRRVIADTPLVLPPKRITFYVVHHRVHVRARSSSDDATGSRCYGDKNAQIAQITLHAGPRVPGRPASVLSSSPAASARPLSRGRSFCLCRSLPRRAPHAVHCTRAQDCTRTIWDFSHSP